MEVLVINCGSSSLKFQLIDSDSEKVLAKGICERIGIKGSVITYQPTGGEKEVSNIDMPTHHEAIDAVIKALTNKETGVINDMSEVKAVGHRVVHGGEYFSKATLVDDDVIKKIEECNYLAPLHNPANIIGIKACMKLMPDTPNVVVFDTAFHQTMPESAYLYAIPRKYYDENKIRRYGFHGTSHSFVSKRVAEIMNKPYDELKTIVCHLGNGASICAVDGGKSVDTSMGLTPLGGLPMVTRSGDLDPSVVTYLMKKENLSAQEMEDILNKESGLSGMSNLKPDFRVIENTSVEGQPDALMAVETFNYSIASYIAKYAVAMNGVDYIIFTGGIGENQINIRKGICEKLAFMGVKIDLDENNMRGEEKVISTPDSTVKVYVIPTNEELMIAKETLRLVK